MATDFIMPRLPDQQQQPYGGHFYMPNPHVSQQQQRSTIAAAQSQAQAQFQLQQQQMSSAASSRQISPLSTSNSTSPTSPKSYHTRQLRPLYIPAVLRPTDYPAKKTPTVKKTDDDDDSLKASSSWSSLTGLGAFGRLARRGTGDSGKCLNGELDMDMFPKPTAEPTRTHWKVSFYTFILQRSVRPGFWSCLIYSLMVYDVTCDNDMIHEHVSLDEHWTNTYFW